MAKNDWDNNEAVTRPKMNQPFFLQSGTIGGTGDAAGTLRVFISPGIMRFPNKSNPVNSVALQSIAFPAQADTRYAVFIRSDGTFLVSGSNAAFVDFYPNITPPRHDAELIGLMQFNGAVAEANLSAPWKTGSTVLAPYEQRSQGVSTVSSRARVVATQNAGTSVGTYAAGITSVQSSVNSAATASGIAWLTMADSGMSDAGTILHATVRFVCSGAITAPNTNLIMTPVFTMYESDDGAISPFAEYPQTVVFGTNQTPDSISRGSSCVQTVSFTSVNNGTTIRTTKGYVLGVFFDPSSNRTDADTSIRITGISFTARPNNKISYSVEPS